LDSIIRQPILNIDPRGTLLETLEVFDAEGFPMTPASGRQAAGMGCDQITVTHPPVEGGKPLVVPDHLLRKREGIEIQAG
jgi:hypothetical protein